MASSIPPNKPVESSTFYPVETNEEPRSCIKSLFELFIRIIRCLFPCFGSSESDSLKDLKERASLQVKQAEDNTKQLGAELEQQKTIRQAAQQEELEKFKADAKIEMARLDAQINKNNVELAEKKAIDEKRLSEEKAALGKLQQRKKEQEARLEAAKGLSEEEQMRILMEQSILSERVTQEVQTELATISSTKYPPLPAPLLSHVSFGLPSTQPSFTMGATTPNPKVILNDLPMKLSQESDTSWCIEPWGQGRGEISLPTPFLNLTQGQKQAEEIGILAQNIRSKLEMSRDEVCAALKPVVESSSSLKTLLYLKDKNLPWMKILHACMNDIKKILQNYLAIPGNSILFAITIVWDPLKDSATKARLLKITPENYAKLSRFVQGVFANK